MDNTKNLNNQKDSAAAEGQASAVVKVPEGLNVEGIVAPKKDTRFKTEDVTATKGLTFADFGLSKEL